MEILCKTVKESECLDFTSEEYVDIARAVDTFIKRLVRYLAEDGEGIQVERLMQCGSIAEKTKLLKRQYTDNVGLEFDYLAIIKQWPGIGEVIYKHTCNGSMEIQYSVTDSESDCGEKDSLSNEAGAMFRLKLVRAIDKRCERNACIQSVYSRESGKRDISFKGCCACTIYLKTGNLRFLSGTKLYYLHLEFLWTPKARVQTGDEKSVFGPDFFDLEGRRCVLLKDPLIGESSKILVDIHPVFELDPSRIENVNNEILTTTILRNPLKLYLFPKCKNNCKHRLQHLCWRISTIQQELALIETTSKDHLLAYMALKFLTVTIYNCMQRISTTAIETSSYWVKTVFLRHISGCRKSYQSVELCVLDMLLDFSNCFLHQNIPHFYLNFNLIEENNMVNVPRWIKAIGEMFKSMGELMMKQNVHKDMANIFKDCISLYLIIWGSDLKARQKAWAEVPMTNLEMLRKAVDRNMRDMVEKNLEIFVTGREVRSAEDLLKDTIKEHVDLQLLSKDMFKMAPFGNKLKEWLKDLYQKKHYRMGVHTFVDK